MCSMYVHRKEVMGENRQIRSRSWNRMPTKRCSANGIMEEFILVDDDEVIILDFPESSKCKAPGTSRTRKESILPRVISIDDDDDDEDETENVQKAGSSSSGNPPAANLQTSAEVDNDDCQFIQEKCATFRFSKFKQTFSTMPSSGIRFGLGSDTDSDFSESDCSDCEILEGSHREVREQWEQAALLRKMKKAGKAGLSEEAGPSNLHSDTSFRPGFGRTEQNDQTSFFFAARTPDGGKAGLSEEAGPSNLHCDNNFRSGFESRTEQHDQTSFFFAASTPDGEKETSSTFFGTDGRIPDMATYFGSVMEEDSRAKHCANSSFFNKEDFQGPSPLSPEIRAEHERFDTPSSHFTSPKEPKHQTSFKKVVEQPNKVQVQCETSQSPEENQTKNAAYQSYTKEVEDEEDASQFSPSETSDGGGDTTHVLGTQSNGARCEHGISSLDESREPIIDPIPSTSGQMQGSNGTAPAIDVMLNREMLKETDEYKKAQEEEWESRQRQLQIQADEAQKQRKRRKLENTRQLEMERRQKERVEEVRETQKKDEESMNMKEKVRAEITKSLKLLELKSFNMASLLRGLGIQVGGGINPLPHEVHAAYKRAVLKFHPDRASRGDIKQQVEAEEKFKLIARMKDKFKLIAH
ncbi:Chaperone J-domain superfamily [Arabidopsis thaliana x Arabidopsis arenosa]|uniref:Chaperone J-domain superfamily n=1 Tax=Arabidopsis thaliana x Arabidopsis arenosa TaxID=1240361 RepID=A0A8T2BKJ3_9BRAS|nr:Chaperone J-domain superfamily [Arabidopsis thaliana x Arabidopsis arenosa]